MAKPEEDGPESIVLGAFNGLKNTINAERLGPQDLARAVNVDLDDAGQLRRRRGYRQISDLPHHSLRTIASKTLVVRESVLGRLQEGFPTFYPIVPVNGPVCYTEVNGEVYFSSPSTQGVITLFDELLDWGHTDGQGMWLSPVINPTATLGEVAGRLLGDPRRATSLCTYKGRIYMANGKTVWATDLYAYHYVDRTRNFMQFEHEVTLLMEVGDGIYVGTEGGLYFLKGHFGAFELMKVTSDLVLPGSGQSVPVELIHPGARAGGTMPTGEGIVVMTAGGIVAGFDGGTCFNLTSTSIIFPQGVSAASLFRQDQGANHYLAAVDSGGGPSANARIGDYVDAEIVRAR